ncbi:hypothetical protein NFI96_001436 [Prochilodus magdalenae]|nr:hypothetical protein NFI96_001436 [Prochilodus magdalenae]
MGIARNLRDLFLHDAGVKDLDAVCLVLKSNQVRISDRQRYIFEAVLSLFSKDIEDIIVLCITHSDGGPPTNALESIKKEKIPCCYDEDEEPVHFLFNNRQSEKHAKKYEYVYKSAWEMAADSDHVRECRKYVTKQRQETVSFKQLKRKYSDANEGNTSYDKPAFKKVKTEHEETLRMKEEMMKMKSNLKTLLAQNEAQKKSLVRDACMSILKLSEIALKPDSAFTIQHLDFLIPQVEEAGTAEWAQKLKDLQRAAASQEPTNSVVELRNASSPAHDLIRKSHMLSPGKIRKWTFGQRYANTQNKTILMVGETGTGKTTLTNTMVNYFLGVKFEDKVWFEITEEEKRYQSESQTSEVTVYEIISEERLSSLTIIDTPGYGDTRGIEKDKDIARNLHELFLHDGGPPTNDLESIKQAKVPCCYDEDEPVHFLFNNQRSMEGFCKFLKPRRRRSVTLTVSVLNERMQLEACVESLKENIRYREAKQNELTEVQEALKLNKVMTERDKKFPLTVTTVYKVKVDVTGASWRNRMVTSCGKCEKNCHEHGCWVTRKAQRCKVMKDNWCTVCNCHYSVHVREGKKYVTTRREEKVTVEKLKNEYGSTRGEKASYDENLFKYLEKEHKKALLIKEMIINLETGLETLLAQNEAQKKSLVRDACMSILKLSEIALKPDSTFTIQYLDFLIPQVEEAGTAEWVQKLRDLQRAAAGQESTNSAVGCLGRKGKDMQNAPPKESTDSAVGCLGRKGNAPPKELPDSAEGCVGRKSKDMRSAPPKESTDSAEGYTCWMNRDTQNAPPKESTDSAVGDAVEMPTGSFDLLRCEAVAVLVDNPESFIENNNHCLEEAAVPTAAPEHVSRWVADQHQLRSTFPGPLMRNDLDKIELVRFIQWKAVECSCTDQSDHQAGHVFWKMMELFCTRENTVKWTDITDLLLRTCKSLRKQDDWHRRLVSLLSSSRDSDDQQRTAVIAMGDTLASAGLINPAHICYTVALVQLSSFRGPTSLVLVGSDDRHPFSEFATSEALERTEVYEYVLSLFSGFGQPDFQVFKLIRAGHLADAGRFDEATKYCESITRAVSSFPSSSSSITTTLLSRLIEVRKLIHTYEDPQLSERVIRDRRTEPDWLIDLRQLKQSKTAEISNTASFFTVIDETAGEHLHLLPPQTDSSVEPVTEFKVTVEEPEEEAEEREEEELAVCSNHLECETGQPEYDLMSTVTSQNPPLKHQTVQQHVCSTVVQQQQHFPSDLSTKEVSDTIPFLFS